MTDLELVREARGQSEQAFEEIVRRYSSLVYASALRRLDQDYALAEDVTQSVFIILHRKRQDLKDDVPLAGWLLKTTAFVARRALTAKFRRQRMEAEVLEESRAVSATVDPLGLPLLDDALLALKAPEQRCISHRFFAGSSFKEIADLEGISEDAAQKRVSRALEKLRSFLVRRGIGVAATAAIAGCLTESAKAAPPEMVSGILSSVSGANAAQAGTGGVVLAKLALTSLVRQQALMAALKIVLVLVALSPIVLWQGGFLRGSRPASTSAPTPAVGPTVAGLAQQWSDVVRSAAALIRAGPPPPNTPEAAAYQQRMNAVFTETTRIANDLNVLLAAGNPRGVLTQFFTFELGANLKLDTTQQARVSRLVALAMSGGGQDATACLSGLVQNKARLIPQIQAMLSNDQRRRFDSIYGADGMALFTFASLAAPPAQPSQQQ